MVDQVHETWQLGLVLIK